MKEEHDATRELSTAANFGSSWASPERPASPLARRRPQPQQSAAWKDWVAKFYNKPIKMAVSCAGTSNPYFAPTKAGAEDAGAQLGIEMLWTGVPDGNTVNQIAQFQQLVNTGYEAIVVISFEPDAWIAPIKKAMAAGVLILTSNNDAPNSGRELYFGQDLVGAAVVQGQMLAKLAGGKGKVAMTNCAPGSLALDQRIQGARQGVKAGGLRVCRRLQHQPGRHGERDRDHPGHPARASGPGGDDAAVRTRYRGRRPRASRNRAASCRSSAPTCSTRRSN